MDQEIINKAYLAGLDLKNSGLSEEVIYARIEKQGFPADLARRVARDIIHENKRESAKNYLNYGLVTAGIGVLATIISVFVFKGGVIIPASLIIGGIALAIFAKASLKNN